MSPSGSPPGRLLLLRLFLLVILGLPRAAGAGSVPGEPVLRIDTAMHTGPVRKLAADAENRYLATASEDKTVRIWDIPRNRLLRILRPPLGEGSEGKLYAVAMTADGAQVACGGRTGMDWDGDACVYLFDARTGEMTGRIPGLPGVVLSLAYSPGDRFLVVGLAQRMSDRAGNGFRVFDPAGGEEIARDGDYAGSVYGMDMDGEGRLATVSDKGVIRLYDSAFHKRRQSRTPDGLIPFSIRFSPDGNRAAVGYINAPRVDVYNGQTLDRSFTLTADDLRGNLSNTAWSADGVRLFAGGKSRRSDGERVVRIWKVDGRRHRGDLTASGRDTVLHLLSLHRIDGLAYGTAGPELGIFSGAGDRFFRKDAPLPYYRDHPEGIPVSHDGSRISFRFSRQGRKTAFFSLDDRLLRVGEGRERGLTPSHARGIEPSRWRDRNRILFGGRTFDLEPFEKGKSVCGSPDGATLLLGTSWNLHRFDRSGRRWRTRLPGAAWAVNRTGDGRLAVAALGDGTIRWYRMSDGAPLLALFPHTDGRRWVLWTPGGYYLASAGADDLIGWHVNRGADRAADFFAVSRFRSAMYRPDVVEKVLDTLDEGTAVRLVDAEAGGRRQEFDLRRRLPPVVTLLSPGDGDRFSTPKVTVRYAIRSPSGEPVTAVKVLVDGRPLPGRRGIRRKKADTGQSRIDLILPERDCEIALIAENRYAASEPSAARLVWAGKPPTEGAGALGPKLYVLAVGVGGYQRDELDLTFPAKDARDLVGVLRNQEKRLYRKVAAKVLTDGEATKDDLLDGLEWIERETTDNDVAMVFLAGHGVNDRNGDYYFLPADGDPDHLRRTGVAYAIIRDVVANLPGKVLFFIDTCHSGNIMGPKRRGGMADVIQVVNDLSAAENGVVVFASSTGRQYSLEDPAWGNGAFTKALVEGLSGDADLIEDRKITVNELDTYIAERVKALTKGQQTPTTAKPDTVPDFPVAVR